MLSGRRRLNCDGTERGDEIGNQEHRPSGGDLPISFSQNEIAVALIPFSPRRVSRRAFFGGKDRFIPVSEVNELCEALKVAPASDPRWCSTGCGPRFHERGAPIIRRLKAHRLA